MSTFKSSQYVDLPGTDTTVYTATAKTVITSLLICNKTGTSKTVSVRIMRGGATAVQLLKDAPISTAGSLEVMQYRTVVLEDTDLLQCAASATSSLDVCVSALEP